MDRLNEAIKYANDYHSIKCILDEIKACYKFHKLPDA